ncbi:hypothetical protein [Streptomyces sp. V1I1]|nr:hypothetical protein [Streptomyces sp. V1I1]MDQ0943367.1 hypothetical protein [Streptomyces sp. V1I1]
MPVFTHFALATGPLHHLACCAAEARRSAGAVDPLEWQELR